MHLFKPTNDLEALLKKAQEPVAKPPTPMDWPSLPVLQESKEPTLPASSIPSEQKTPVNNNPATSVFWSVKKKNPEQ